MDQSETRQTELGTRSRRSPLLKEVVQEFLGESPILLTNAEQAAAAAGDTEMLRKQAHSLRGPLLFLGLDPVFDTIGQVESLAADGKLAQSHNALRAFKADYQSVVRSLRQFIDG